MTKQRTAVFFLMAFLVLVFGCDRGLAPITEDTGFSGTITFKNWPPPEQVLELRLVAFEQYPADSSGIIAALLNSQAAIYPHVTTGVAAALEVLGNRVVHVHGQNLDIGQGNAFGIGLRQRLYPRCELL